MLGTGATTGNLMEMMPSFKKLQDSWGKRLINSYKPNTLGAVQTEVTWLVLLRGVIEAMYCFR